MIPRRKKGCAPLFNKPRVVTLLSEDESDEESVELPKSRRNKKNKEVPDQSQIIDLCEGELPSTNNNANDEGAKNNARNEESLSSRDTEESAVTSSFADFVEQTNIREIVDEYLQKHFSDTEISTLKDPFLKYFYKIYTENPTSRRCTEVNLHQLTFRPPQFSSVEKKLLDKHKIEDCTVAMGSANVLFSIEKRIYRRFRKKNPTTRTHIDFFQPKTFHTMSMEYLQHIHSNVESILRHPEIDRGKIIEDLVTLLFDRLDALTPCEELPLTPISIEDLESTREEANVTEEIHLEDVSLAEELSPQKTLEVMIPSTPISIEILDFEFKDPYHCTAKGVEEQLFHDGKLEIPIEIFTRNGPMDITLRHDDIGRFLNVKLRVWKGIKAILAEIENEESATQQRKVLQAKFSNVFCEILSRAKGRNPGFTRYYIQHFDGNVTQNCIEVIHKMY